MDNAVLTTMNSGVSYNFLLSQVFGQVFWTLQFELWIHDMSLNCEFVITWTKFNSYFWQYRDNDIVGISSK